MDIHTKKYINFIHLFQNTSFNNQHLVFKLSKFAKERNENDRTTFVLHMMQYTPNQLVFSDESAYDRRTLFRRYGWNKSGFRARSSCFFIRGRKYTIEAALCINGLLAYGFQKGPMDSKDYEYFIEFVLVSNLFKFYIYYFNI